MTVGILVTIARRDYILVRMGKVVFRWELFFLSEGFIVLYYRGHIRSFCFSSTLTPFYSVFKGLDSGFA